MPLTTRRACIASALLHANQSENEWRALIAAVETATTMRHYTGPDPGDLRQLHAIMLVIREMVENWHADTIARKRARRRDRLAGITRHPTT